MNIKIAENGFNIDEHLVDELVDFVCSISFENFSGDSIMSAVIMLDKNVIRICENYITVGEKYDYYITTTEQQNKLNRKLEEYSKYVEKKYALKSEDFLRNFLRENKTKNIFEEKLKEYGENLINLAGKVLKKEDK